MILYDYKSGTGQEFCFKSCAASEVWRSNLEYLQYRRKKSIQGMQSFAIRNTGREMAGFCVSQPPGKLSRKAL